MNRWKWLGLVLLVAAAPAWGQSEEEIEAGAGPQMQAYGHCLRDRTMDFARADRAASNPQILARANLACKAERKALWEQYQEAPLSMSPAEATRQLDEALEYIEPDIKEMIKKARES
jgi:hypothetical protein